MLEVLLAFVFIVIMFAAMAIGVIFGREPIKGSCGGQNGGSCGLCGNKGKCKRKQESEASKLDFQ